MGDLVQEDNKMFIFSTVGDKEISAEFITRESEPWVVDSAVSKHYKNNAEKYMKGKRL